MVKTNKLTTIVASIAMPIATMLGGCNFNGNAISTDSTKKTAPKFTRFYEAGPNVISDEAYHMYTNEYARNFGPETFEEPH